MALKTQTNIPITNIERIATELRSIRRARKITQQELAVRAEIARRTVTNAESAENIGLKELCRIVNALGYELALRPKDTVIFEELSSVFKDDDSDGTTLRYR